MRQVPPSWETKLPLAQARRGTAPQENRQRFHFFYFFYERSSFFFGAGGEGKEDALRLPRRPIPPPRPDPPTPLHQALRGQHSSTLLPPPQFHSVPFGSDGALFSESSLDLSSRQASSGGSRAECSSRTRLDSSAEDPFMGSFAHRALSSDEAGYHMSSSGSSLDSADFSLGGSPGLGGPGAHLSKDRLNFSWTRHPTSSPRPQQTGGRPTASPVVPVPVRACPSRDTPSPRLRTPNTQLPLFGASPVPVAPPSSSATGRGYLCLTDTSPPCDRSLSSPGDPSDDSNWKWDPSQNSLMNLASLSQCVLNTDLSPLLGSGTDASSFSRIRGRSNGSKQLSSVSSTLFVNGADGRAGQPRTKGIAQSSSHSRSPLSPQTDMDGGEVDLSYGSVDSADTPSSGATSTAGEASSAGESPLDSNLSEGRARQGFGQEGGACTALPLRGASSTVWTTGKKRGGVAGDHSCSMKLVPSREVSSLSLLVAVGEGASKRESSTKEEESGNRSPDTRSDGTKKRKTVQCLRAAPNPDDDMMQGAIGDVKRLRMLSPG